MRLLGFLIFLIVAILGGGAAFLASWDIPAPTRAIEKEIPDDRLGR